MDFELRELKSTDIFPMFKIMGKIGFKDLKERLTQERIKDITGMMKQNAAEDSADPAENTDDMVTYVGFNVIMEVADILLSNLPKCEEEIYSFVGSVAGLKVAEVKDLSMVDFTKAIIAILQKEEFKDFFKVVSSLFK